MDVQLIIENGRTVPHPEFRDALVQFPPWRRHAVHHRLCAKVYDMVTPGETDRETAGDPTLSERGVAVLPGLLGSDEAAALSRRADAILAAGRDDGDPTRPVTDDPDHAAELVDCDSGLRDAIAGNLPAILNPKATAAIERYYGSHFRIDNLRFYRTFPAPRSTISFLWHRDVAPMAQVHIMVYLTDSGAAAGGTSFLDLAQTRAAAQAGYHYLPLVERSGDIERIMAATGIQPRVQRPELAAGDGVVFASARVLHRGNLPTAGYRDVLILVLLPSFHPWHRDTDDFGPGYLFINDAKSTLETDPYRPFNPNLGYMPGKTQAPREDWIRLGDLFPPGL